MSSLIITKQTGNFFSLVLDGGSPIVSEQNRLTTIGNFCNFKTANGANLILKQNILYSDITIITGASHVPTSINDLWISLLDAGFFDGLATTGGSSTIDKFTELLDTFSSYIGRDGQLLVVNESEQKIETISISLFSEDDRTKLDGIETGAEVNVQSNWNETNPLSDAFIQNKPDLGLGYTAEDVANKVSKITGYDVDLYPNEKATHDALDLKLNISDLPTNLTLYPTNVTSDVSGYVKMVTDIHDADYNTAAVDISTPTITTTDQLVASLITDAGVLIGQPGVFNATTFGNIRRLSGSGTATFHFKVFHRDSVGTETLIGTSSNTEAVTSSSYLEFTGALLWDDGDFVDTDRIVIKYYANRIAGGSDPIYQFQFGGTTPVRTLLPVPFSVVDAGYELKANKQNDLTPDGTGTKYPTVDAVNAVLPTTYSKVVYVNATSPTTSTIFDTENPPVTNDNALKNDTANLYIGTDASTWVYLTGTGYVTKTVSSATSNFYNAGTTVDAGNSKTSHITRSGNISTTGKLSSSGATTLATTATETAYIGTTTSNPDLAKFVVKGTKSGTGSHIIASFLNNSGIRVASIDDLGSLYSSYDVIAYNFRGTAGSRFKSGASGGLETSTGKFFVESANGWKSFHVLEYESVLASTYNAKSLVPKDYVDAKITQTITNGVTDKSPSEDAVFDALDLKVSGSGTTNYIPKFTASGTIGNSLIFDNGTNIGIGTTSPTSSLQVKTVGQGSIKIGGANGRTIESLSSTGVSTNTDILNGISSPNMYVTNIIDRDTNQLAINFGSNFMSFKTANTEKARISVNGALLLNTTTDDGVTTNKLQVNGNVKATQFRISALNTAPLSATDTGTLGEVRITATHIYVCTATNTWVRTALTTW